MSSLLYLACAVVSSSCFSSCSYVCNAVKKNKKILVLNHAASMLTIAPLVGNKILPNRSNCNYLLLKIMNAVPISAFFQFKFNRENPLGRTSRALSSVKLGRPSFRKMSIYPAVASARLKAFARRKNVKIRQMEAATFPFCPKYYKFQISSFTVEK